MAVPSEILVDVFSFIDNFSVVSVALSYSRFLELVSENAHRLPLVREFFFQCTEPGLVLSEGTPWETDAGYSCGIEFDRSNAEACREAFRTAASIAGKHVISGAYFWYVFDLPIPVEELLESLPSLRFAEKLELGDDVRAESHPSFGEFDPVNFSEQFTRLKRVHMGTVEAALDWAFLRRPAFLSLTEFSVSAALSENPDAEDEVLRFCTDFSMLEHGQRKTVALPRWNLSEAIMDKLIQRVGTCQRRVVISLNSGHSGSLNDPAQFLSKTGRDFMMTTRRYKSRVMNVTVFVETYGVTITNDAEKIAKKSAVVDDPSDFQDRQLWDTLRNVQ